MRKVCIECKKPFATEIYWARFCSSACKDRAHYIIKKKRGWFEQRKKARGKRA